MVRPPQDMRRDASRDMGSLLLRGWTMMAEYCPACLVPLMRDPATRHEHCVQCGTVYTDGGQQVVNQPTAADAAAPSATSPATDNGPAAAAAPATADQEPAPAGGERMQPAAGVGEVDDAAERLSQRLMQGWALLNDHCPVCSTPLMRDLERQRQCVVCNAPVYTEQEAAARRASAAPDAAASSSPAAAAQLPAATESLLPDTAAATGPGAASARNAAAADLHRSPRQAGPQPSTSDQLPAPKQVPASTASPAAGGPSSEPGKMLEAAGAAVLAKISETTALLNQTAPMEAEKCRQYVLLLRECIITHQQLGWPSSSGPQNQLYRPGL